MFNRFFTALLLLSLAYASSAQAHDDNLATVYIRHIDRDQWIFQLMTPLNQLDQSARRSTISNHLLSSETATSDNEYKRALVAYIKQGFDVSAWGVDNDGTGVQAAHLTLGAGRMRLDEHLSTFTFEINGMPDRVLRLDFHLAYMTENENQNNFLRLIDGDRSQRYILNVKNNFSGIDRDFFDSSDG